MDHFSKSRLISTHLNRKEYAKKEFALALGGNRLPCDVSVWEYEGARAWAHIEWDGGHVQIFEPTAGAHLRNVRKAQSRRMQGLSPFYLSEVYRDPWGCMREQYRRWKLSDCSDRGRRLMVRGKFNEPGYVNIDGMFVPVYWNSFTDTWKEQP